ncbi:unnamed protein product [Caenorhabditis sp. 36 PRJEB53466]|nr:unnamed protein product [Caenorhabditis sp. 36 PRJEB53466]
MLFMILVIGFLELLTMPYFKRLLRMVLPQARIDYLHVSMRLINDLMKNVAVLEEKLKDVTESEKELREQLKALTDELRQARLNEQNLKAMNAGKDELLQEAIDAKLQRERQEEDFTFETDEIVGELVTEELKRREQLQRETEAREAEKQFDQLHEVFETFETNCEFVEIPQSF